ncbi:MAG TPA: hypothetical protein VF778_04850 [Xanthobacteraceae bacterium]
MAEEVAQEMPPAAAAGVPQIASIPLAATSPWPDDIYLQRPWGGWPQGPAYCGPPGWVYPDPCNGIGGCG